MEEFVQEFQVVSPPAEPSPLERPSAPHITLPPISLIGGETFTEFIMRARRSYCHKTLERLMRDAEAKLFSGVEKFQRAPFMYNFYNLPGNVNVKLFSAGGISPISRLADLNMQELEALQIGLKNNSIRVEAVLRQANIIPQPWDYLKAVLLDHLQLRVPCIIDTKYFNLLKEPSNKHTLDDLVDLFHPYKTIYSRKMLPYRWSFSSEYTRFPNKVASEWTIKEIVEFRNALHTGNLSAVAFDSTGQFQAINPVDHQPIQPGPPQQNVRSGSTTTAASVNPSPTSLASQSTETAEASPSPETAKISSEDHHSTSGLSDTGIETISTAFDDDDAPRSSPVHRFSIIGPKGEGTQTLPPASESKDAGVQTIPPASDDDEVESMCKDTLITTLKQQLRKSMTEAGNHLTAISTLESNIVSANYRIQDAQSRLQQTLNENYEMRTKGETAEGSAEYRIRGLESALAATKQEASQTLSMLQTKSKVVDDLHTLLQEARDKDAMAQTEASQCRIENDAQIRELKTQLEESEAETLKCQEETFNLQQEVTEKARGFQDQLSAARREGEIHGRESARNDLEISFESEISALRLSYLEELDTTRIDEYDRGFRAGKEHQRVETCQLQRRSEELKYPNQPGIEAEIKAWFEDVTIDLADPNFPLSPEASAVSLPKELRTDTSAKRSTSVTPLSISRTSPSHKRHTSEEDSISPEPKRLRTESPLLEDGTLVSSLEVDEDTIVVDVLGRGPYRPRPAGIYDFDEDTPEPAPSKNYKRGRKVKVR